MGGVGVGGRAGREADISSILNASELDKCI